MTDIDDMPEITTEKKVLTTKCSSFVGASRSTEHRNSDAIYPTFEEYFDSIHEFLTNKDNKFYIRFKWLSPLKIQIANIYFVKSDDDEKYLKEFRCRHFIYKASDIGINASRTNRPTLFECFKNEKYELKPIKKLPYELFK